MNYALVGKWIFRQTSNEREISGYRGFESHWGRKTL